MSRKLHNTLMAVIASSSLLTVGLIAGTPVMPSLHSGNASPPAYAALDQVPASPVTSLERAKPDPATPNHQPPAARSNRQSVSMPFFSFVPRG